MDASDFAFGVSLYEDGQQVAFERKKTKTPLLSIFFSRKRTFCNRSSP